MNNTILEEKIEILSKLIDLTAALYHAETTNEGQRSYLQTILIRALHFLPTEHIYLYSGKISSVAYKQLMNPSENHEKLIKLPHIPLKHVVKQLYTTYLSEIIGDSEALKNLYIHKLALFHLVTREECICVARYSLNEEANAYSKANIVFLNKTHQELLPFIKKIQRELND